MATIATWDGVAIDPEALVGYAWFNTTIVVNSTSYRLLYGHMVAHLREADAKIAAIGGYGVSAVLDLSTTTTDADPGDGTLRLNNATQNAATQIYVDLLDANGADITTLLDSLDDSTSAVKGILTVRQVNDTTKWLQFNVTAVTTASGYRKLTVGIRAQSTATPFADGARVSITFTPSGDRGWPANGFRWTFSTGTTDADPGAGVVRLNNATQSSATQAFIDLLDADGNTQTTWLDGLAAATGSRKGQVRIAAQADPTRYVSGLLSAVTTASGYRKLVFAVQSYSASPLLDAETVFVSFEPAGDTGGLTGGTWTGNMAAAGYNLTGVGTVSATTATITAFTVAGQILAAQYAEVDSSTETDLTVDGPQYHPVELTGDHTFNVFGALPDANGVYQPCGYVLDIVQGSGGGYVPTFQKGNQFTHSEQSDNAVYTKTRSSIGADAAVAPNGTTTADKLVEDSTASNTHAITRTGSATSGVAVTRSIFAKAGERTRISLAFSNTGAFSATQRATFNLSTGATSVDQGSPTVTITEVVDGWYRCSITATPTSTGTATCILYLDNGSTVTYSGDGASGAFIWGDQFAPGSTPKGYIAVGASRDIDAHLPSEPVYASQAAGVITRVEIPVPAYDGNVVVTHRVRA